jgi:hypothetical protein
MQCYKNAIKGGEKMKQVKIVSLVLVLLFSLAALAQAKPRIYKWVKDKKTSSQDILRKTQYSRVISASERSAQSIIQKIMTNDLYMSLAKYHKTRHQQDAETTPDSVLPEEVIRQQEIELIDEDYRFILEVKTRRYGNRTRVTAKASPVYRLRDLEAEEARDEDDETGSAIQVKVKANQSSAVAMGPIVVAPILGLPSDYGIMPLPDASQRAAEIVKSFMYFLDKRMRRAEPSEVMSAPVPDEKEPVSESGETQAAPSSPDEGEAAVEVEVDIKQKK